MSSRAPCGYRYVLKREGVPGHLVIDDAEADLVRTMYRWLIDERMSIRQLLLPPCPLLSVRVILGSVGGLAMILGCRSRTSACGRHRHRVCVLDHAGGGEHH
ncbi:MAG: hypothetical protein LC797_00515 [Chloroflexi bacterium]|nr:hypothetical protein [Chloroflexota bacterium]